MGLKRLAQVYLAGKWSSLDLKPKLASSKTHILPFKAQDLGGGKSLWLDFGNGKGHREEWGNRQKVYQNPLMVLLNTEKHCKVTDVP